MRRPPEIPDLSYGLRCDVVADGPSTFGFVLVAFREACLLLGIGRADPGQPWSEARALLGPDAATAEPSALREALSWMPARVGFLIALGLLHDGPPEDAAGLLSRFATRRADPAGLRTGGIFSDVAHAALSPGHALRRGYGALEELGMAPAGRLVNVYEEAWRLRESNMDHGVRGGTAPVGVLGPGAGTGPVLDALGGWCARLRPLVRPPDTAFVRAEHWSHATLSRFAVDGRVGGYRRQAGRLYPALAPILVNDPGISALVDAGRPFEGALAARLGELSGIPTDRPLTVAALRRLRGVREEIPARNLAQAVMICSFAPLDRVPATPGGWRWYVEDVRALHFREWCATAGMFHVPRIPPAPDGLPPVTDEALSALSDFCRAFASTFVLPLVGEGPTPPFEKPSALRGSVMSAAVRIILAGADMRGCLARSAGWHGRLGPFWKAMPRGVDKVRWPAPFRELTLQEVRFVPLTVPSALRDEGGKWEDPDGLPGLDHCVGTFGRDCWAGDTAIVSMRRDEGGRWARSSTFELCPTHGPDLVTVGQHRGLRNADPSPADAAALGALVRRIHAGNLRLDMAAFRGRPADRYDDGIDWGLPENLRMSLAAWEPHLPRRARGLGLDGMLDLVRSELVRTRDGGARA